MKKLSYEDGCIVLREVDGTLYWSIDVVDLKDPTGGYISVCIEGILTERKDYSQKDERHTL